MHYLPRIADTELAARLAASGAVVIEGPRACGKTETARRQASSEVLLDVDLNAQQMAGVDPSLILAGDSPRLIDEWQLHPAIWNHIRRAVDEGSKAGMFILTGSAVPPDDATRHTGAGRFGRLRMRPMSLAESGAGSHQVSLAQLLTGEATSSADPGLALGDLIGEVIRGGWPGYRDLSVKDAMRANRDYLDQMRHTDISTVEGIRRDPERVLHVMRSLARNTATQARLTNIARDASGADARVKDDTVAAYLQALTRLMIVEDQPAWSPHLRSSYDLRSAPTRHFVDPSLAVAALRATPNSLLADLNTFGLLFESLVIRDLRVYGQANDATISHYRDSSGLEVDAIVSADDGTWAALEVKLGATEAIIDKAALNLSAFARRVDTASVGEPGALGVVVGAGYGYVRDDGIHVIPIAALGP